MKRICKKCLIDKDIEDFPLYKRDLRRFTCQSCMRSYSSKWFQDNLIREKNKRTAYRKNNSEKIKKLIRNWQKRQALVPSRRIKNALCARIRRLVLGANSSTRIEEYLGCSIQDFRLCLENLLKDGMSWDNYGKNGWHIAHIIPCAFFDLDKESELKQCFHYTNLQPLWATENLLKLDRLPSGQLARDIRND